MGAGKLMSKKLFRRYNIYIAGWASMHGLASYMPMYWHVHDILDARSTAKIVLMWPGTKGL